MIKGGIEGTDVPCRVMDLPLQLCHAPRSTLPQANDVGQVANCAFNWPILWHVQCTWHSQELSRPSMPNHGLGDLRGVMGRGTVPSEQPLGIGVCHIFNGNKYTYLEESEPNSMFSFINVTYHTPLHWPSLPAVCLDTILQTS